MVVFFLYVRRLYLDFSFPKNLNPDLVKIGPDPQPCSQGQITIIKIKQYRNNNKN